MKKFREKRIIKKIRKIQKADGNSCLKYLALNSIQSRAACLVLSGIISLSFYKSVFHGGDITHHWSDVNAEFIKNYGKRA